MHILFMNPALECIISNIVGPFARFKKMEYIVLNRKKSNFSSMQIVLVCVYRQQLMMSDKPKKYQLCIKMHASEDLQLVSSVSKHHTLTWKKIMRKQTTDQWKMFANTQLLKSCICNTRNTQNNIKLCEMIHY